MPEEKIYKRNFLENVIFRIDFIDKIELGGLKDFSEDIKESFPISEQKERKEGFINLDIETEKLQHSINKTASWLFSNKNKDKKLQINPRDLTLEYSKYKGSKELLKDLNKVIIKFISTFEIKTIKRVGLRYTNKIELKENDYLNWKKYINNDLLGGLNFSVSNKKNTARTMGLLVFKEEFGNTNFNFGIWNDDYPDEINRKQFILDFDCYSVFPLDVSKGDFVGKIEVFHKCIVDLFESAITDDFRELLNK